MPTVPSREVVVTTVGHGTLSAEELSELLQRGGVERLVDIRRYPGSRRFPWFGRDEMERWLPTEGIEYRDLPQLGGRRRADPDTPNTAWRNAQFAAYADHMATSTFAEGIRELIDLADRPVAIMCSESVWWRCHRRLVADHLVLVEGVAVEHLFHDGRRNAHEPMAAAVRVGRHVEYPAAGTRAPESSSAGGTSLEAG